MVPASKVDVEHAISATSTNEKSRERSMSLTKSTNNSNSVDAMRNFDTSVKQRTGPTSIYSTSRSSTARSPSTPPAMYPVGLSI